MKLNSGGLLGIIGNQTISGPLTLSGTTGFSRLDTFDPISNSTNVDLIFTGMLQGNGNAYRAEPAGNQCRRTGLALARPHLHRRQCIFRDDHPPQQLEI